MRILAFLTLIYLSLPLSAQYKFFGEGRREENWAIGIYGGSGVVLGDVAYKPGMIGGLHWEKSVNRWFSYRLSAGVGQYLGQDYKPTGAIQFNTALNGTRDSIFTPHLAYDTVSPRVFMNYQTNTWNVGVQVKANLIRIASKSYDKGFDLYLVGGIHSLFYRSMMDMAKNGVQYDFSQISGTSTADAKSQLAQLLDGDFETVSDPTKQQGFGGYQNFSFVGGAGLRQRIGDRCAIGLEANYLYLQDDGLDGQQWELDASAKDIQSKSFDAVANGSLYFQVIF